MLKVEDRIHSKTEFKLWVMQDRVSCGYAAVPTYIDRICDFFAPNYILRFLYLLRRVEYLSNCKKGWLWGGQF